MLDIDSEFFRRREDYVRNGIPGAVYEFHAHRARRERNRAMGDAARAVGRWLRRLLSFPAPAALPARAGR